MGSFLQKTSYISTNIYALWGVIKMKKNDYETKLNGIQKLVENEMPHLPYHNFRHATDVYAVVGKLAKLEGAGEENTFNLKTAGLLHDVVYIVGAKDNEKKSAEFARKYLPEFGYTLKQIDAVLKLIIATKFPTNPQNNLEEIICDADLNNLSRNDFFKRSKELIKEVGGPERPAIYYQSSIYGKIVTTIPPKSLGIYRQFRQLKFLMKYTYYTKTAKTSWQKGVEENIKKVEKKIQEQLREYESEFEE